MRIVTWNCNRSLHTKIDRLMSLGPDLAVNPECANPTVLRKTVPAFCFSGCARQAFLSTTAQGVPLPAFGGSPPPVARLRPVPFGWRKRSPPATIGWSSGLRPLVAGSSPIPLKQWRPGALTLRSELAGWCGYGPTLPAGGRGSFATCPTPSDVQSLFGGTDPWCAGVAAPLDHVERVGRVQGLARAAACIRHGPLTPQPPSVSAVSPPPPGTRAPGYAGKV